MFYTCLKATAASFRDGFYNVEGLNKMLGISSMTGRNLENYRAKVFLSSLLTLPSGPLLLCAHLSHIMQEATRLQISVAFSSAAMTDNTSPITMASKLVQMNAEKLTGISICQMTLTALRYFMEMFNAKSTYRI